MFSVPQRIRDYYTREIELSRDRQFYPLITLIEFGAILAGTLNYAATLRQRYAAAYIALCVCACESHVFARPRAAPCFSAYARGTSSNSLISK